MRKRQVMPNDTADKNLGNAHKQEEQSMITKTLFSSFPIVAALGKEAEDFIAADLLQTHDMELTRPLVWKPKPGKPLQAQLVSSKIWGPTLAALSQIDPDELVSFAHWDPDEVNRFLREHGCEIQLDPWDKTTHQEFGIAAIVNFLRYWQVCGERDYYILEYCKAFRLGTGKKEGGVTFLHTLSDEVVIRIPTTKPSDYVYMTKSPRISHFDLLLFCMATQATMQQTNEFTGAILPQWSFEHLKVEVSDLIGLAAKDNAGQMWRVMQALMEGDCTFCAEGFLFKAAFAASVAKECCMMKEPRPEDVIFDYPVAAWLSKQGVPVPLGAVWISDKEFVKYDPTMKR